MPLPLPHIEQKLHRASEHIVQVQKGIERIIRSIPNPVVAEDDADAVAKLQETLRRIRITDPLQIIAGEAIHQTRSALDHFAAQLAGPCWHRGTEFPIQIYRPTEPNEIGRFQGKIKGFSPEASALVKALQPYELTPQRRDNYLLTILKHLNNRDKHRTLLSLVAAAKPRTVFNTGVMRVEFEPDDDADPAVPALDSVVGVERQFSASIVFPEFGSARNYPVVQGLTHLRWGVTRLIREFKDVP